MIVFTLQSHVIAMSILVKTVESRQENAIKAISLP